MTITGGTLRMSRTGRVRIRLGCPLIGTLGCRDRVRLVTVAKLGLRPAPGGPRRVLALGGRAFRIGGGQTREISVRHPSRGRALVRNRARLAVRAIVVAEDPRGSRLTTAKRLRVSKWRPLARLGPVLDQDSGVDGDVAAGPTASCSRGCAARMRDEERGDEQRGRERRRGEPIEAEHEGTHRFAELRASLAGISPTTLTDRLRALEERGLLERRICPEIPPRAEYTLSARGRDLEPIIASLAPWGRRLPAE